MRNVPQTLIDRWLTRRYTGANRPMQTVYVQRGLLDRTYQPFVRSDGVTDDFGTIAGGKHNDKPWQAFWRPTASWKVVPNISDVRIDNSFENNGVATATITVANALMADTAGAAGTFRTVQRGWMSWWRGLLQPGRQWPGINANDWSEVLTGGHRITVWQGYGDSSRVTFDGLIDDSDIQVTPDQIVVTARDFGQGFTDMRVFGWNKAADLKSPITFADRKSSDDVTAVGGGATASSSDAGNPPRYVTVTGHETYWLSQGHSTPSVTEWVQVRVTAGRYESVFIDPHYEGMEVYLSIFARDYTRVDGQTVPDGFISRGLGVVPGSNGGHPYVKKWNTMDSVGRSYNLPFVLECGDGTVIRLSFRNLQRSPSKGDYRAGCSRLAGMKRKRKDEAKKNKWILVEDYTDIVKWVFMWAGFNEWEVEPSGVRMKEPMTFHQGDFLVDIINHVKSQANYIFYVRPPDNPDESIGRPVFRLSGAVKSPPARMYEFRDTDFLSDVNPKFTKEPLAYIIRVRGAMARKKQGGEPLGEDSVLRFNATYMPPWSGAHHDPVTGAAAYYGVTNRLAGVVKHVTQTIDNLTSNDECMMAAIQIALLEILSAFTMTCEIAGVPTLDVDDQVSIVENASGINSRLWLASVSSQFTINDDGTRSWRTTLGGSLIDTPDNTILSADFNALLAKVKAQGELR